MEDVKIRALNKYGARPVKIFAGIFKRHKGAAFPPHAMIPKDGYMPRIKTKDLPVWDSVSKPPDTYGSDVIQCELTPCKYIEFVCESESIHGKTAADILEGDGSAERPWKNLYVALTHISCLVDDAYEGYLCDNNNVIVEHEGSADSPIAVWSTIFNSSDALGLPIKLKVRGVIDYTHKEVLALTGWRSLDSANDAIGVTDYTDCEIHESVVADFIDNALFNISGIIEGLRLSSTISGYDSVSASAICFYKCALQLRIWSQYCICIESDITPLITAADDSVSAWLSVRSNIRTIERYPQVEVWATDSNLNLPSGYAYVRFAFNTDIECVQIQGNYMCKSSVKIPNGYSFGVDKVYNSSIVVSSDEFWSAVRASIVNGSTIVYSGRSVLVRFQSVYNCTIDIRTGAAFALETYIYEHIEGNAADCIIYNSDISIYWDNTIAEDIPDKPPTSNYRYTKSFAAIRVEDPLQIIDTNFNLDYTYIPPKDWVCVLFCTVAYSGGFDGPVYISNSNSIDKKLGGACNKIDYYFDCPMKGY